ncbi:MAG: nucleotidyltransferase domain-containing protein [Candidatus Rokubacteria bacterium]|nr:nucleotidyltransferase domain-containing protein [Candidatus Rokubacteria bacterium]
MSRDARPIVEVLRDVLRDGPPVRLAILFGSRAGEAARHDSDVDVGIIPRDPDLPLAAELGLQARCERACGHTVDLVRLDRASSLLRWEAARNAVVIVANPPHELPRFLAGAALEHAELMETLGDAPERYRRRLAETGRQDTTGAWSTSR